MIAHISFSDLVGVFAAGLVAGAILATWLFNKYKPKK
jgi:hypothetical protein